VPEAKIDALYSEMNRPFWESDCGSSLTPVQADLYKSVPPQEEVNVLAEIIERAAKVPSDTNVIFNATYLALRINGSPTWSNRLEAALLSQVHSPNKDIQYNLVQLFLKQKSVAHRDDIIPLIYSLLEEKDDHFRGGILSDLTSSGWPETGKICEDYLKRTQPGQEHKESRLYAERFTNPADEHRALLLFNRGIKPQNLDDYLAYIAQHKGDPDYDVSVDQAEQSAKLIQENLQFSAAENAKHN